jgi:hypothetical protein
MPTTLSKPRRSNNDETKEHENALEISAVNVVVGGENKMMQQPKPSAPRQTLDAPRRHRSTFRSFKKRCYEKMTSCLRPPDVVTRRELNRCKYVVAHSHRQLALAFGNEIAKNKKLQEEKDEEMTKIRAQYVEDMNKVKEELQSLKATTEALSREIASVTAANGIVSDSLKERCTNLEEALSQTMLRSCFNDTSQNQPSSELVAANRLIASYQQPSATIVQTQH